MGTTEHVAFNALLNATYDVVIRLDESMTIYEGGDKLACLLLQECSTYSRNPDFTRTMPLDHDKRHFTSYISQAGLETSDIARALHVQMRDGTGNLVAVELFH